MSAFVLHAFLIPSDGTIKILPLRTEYHMEVVSDADGVPVVSLERAESVAQPDSAVSLPIDSVTVVYGINGGGKTQLLLNICNSLARAKGERPLGILWETHGRLYFDPGSHLRQVRFQGQWQVERDSLPMHPPAFGTVFYTTSPFEAARRRLSFSASPTLDATPSFNSDNPFNGVSLLRAARALPSDLPFISATEVVPKVKIPSLRSLIEEYTAERRRDRLAPAEPKYAALRPEMRASLRRLPDQLDQQLAMLLSIEMHRTRLLGKDEATALLLELAAALQGSNTAGSVHELLQRRGSQQDTPNAFQIMEALAAGKTTGRMRLGRKGALLAYVGDASTWSDATVQGLQQAESLGILKWSFLGLSSGQVAMLMLFASLASALGALAQTGKHSLVLTVDEGEMFMHPAWQRTYLSHLLNFLRFYRTDFIGIHLVLATHSLIVAGDAPPYRLFDVVSGKMQNGFAARPEELLDTVYHVKNFAGEFVDSLYAEIGEFLRDGGTDAEGLKVRTLVSQIASKRLRAYLEDEVDRRIGARHAED